MGSGRGLTQVVEADLKRLLRALHRGHLTPPISRSGLVLAAFGNIEEHLDALVGLDVRGAQSLVAAVLAERQRTGAGRATLAVSGPSVTGTLSQDTSTRVNELLAGATRSVLVLGAHAHEDASLLRTVDAMSTPRGVEVTLIGRQPGALDGFEAPEGWSVYTPRDLTLHTRGVVIDRSRALLTGEPLSGREREDALHLGVLVDDGGFVASLLEELERLTRSDRLVAV